MIKKHYVHTKPTGRQIYLYRLLQYKCKELKANYVPLFAPQTREQYAEEIDKIKEAIRKTGYSEPLRIVDLKGLDKKNASLLATAPDEVKEGLPPTKAQLVTFAHLAGVCRERGITPVAEPDVYTRAEFRKAVLYLAQLVNGPEPTEIPEGLRLEDADDLLDNETILTVQDTTGTGE